MSTPTTTSTTRTITESRRAPCHLRDVTANLRFGRARSEILAVRHARTPYRLHLPHQRLNVSARAAPSRRGPCVLLSDTAVAREVRSSLSEPAPRGRIREAGERKQWRVKRKRNRKRS